MSDPSQPKGGQGESPTRAFKLKFDGWMTEMLKHDLDPAAGEAEPAAEAAPGTERAAPQAPSEPASGLELELEPLESQPPPPPAPPRGGKV